MQKEKVQMLLFDTYKDVSARSDEHIDGESLIPARFYLTFYQKIGCTRTCLPAVVSQRNDTAEDIRLCKDDYSRLTFAIACSN